MNTTAITVGTVALLTAASVSLAEYALESQRIDGGAATMSHESTTLRASIGQPDAGTLAGSGWTLQGGFWPAVAPIPVCPGDADGDQAVTFADLEIVLDFWGDSVEAGMSGDLNGDASVNFSDLEILLDAWGSQCG